MYFDKVQNEKDKAIYYRDVDFSDKEKLKAQLSGLIERTHLNKLNYKPSLFLYPEVDRQESGKLASIYSGKEFNLHELLMLDAQVDIRREAVKTQLKLSSEEMRGEMFENIERENPYNCEHVVPQSWFKEAQPMKGDLHHLFTCESNCNRFRDNHKYHEFPRYEGVMEDCGRLENGLFEPLRNRAALPGLYCFFYCGILVKSINTMMLT